MTRLSGKVALITGGGTGIGRACALRFASEGAKVAIVGRRKELLAKTQREIQVSGGEAFAMECDVTESGQVNHAVRAVAVGTEIALRPPHRSRRALLTHRALALDGDEEPLFRPRMQDAWEWQVPVGDLLHPRPRQSTPLAATHESAVPAFDHMMPEC